jgi:PAS domain S-box-containing protein
MTILSRVSLLISILLMLIFLYIQSIIIFNAITYFDMLGYFGFAIILSFIPFFTVFAYEYVNKNKIGKIQNAYIKKLNETLILLSQDPIFYEGNISEGAKNITKRVAESINSDRCSIWLYNKDRTSIICEQLYIKSENTWYEDIEILKKDFHDYFLALLLNPVIIANDAETHQATSCFTNLYLRPLGIKSMLDVPITYQGETIGVICIESLTKREWTKTEIDFAQMSSSLYSFSYSVKEINRVNLSINDIENFIDYSALVTKADKNGKIIYVNKRFEEVSGWKLKQVVGKDHNIVNSGIHPKEFWNNMYKTIIKDKKIWNKVVINKKKCGDLYWVDSFIKAEFDSENGELKGFMSIRYDVTDLMMKTEEIERKNTYLEHAAKILRHDMHSGINTYIPRGVSSLERRLNDDVINEFKLESPLKMIKEGLKHSQKVYKGVYEFTNLVKKDSKLEKTMCDLKEIFNSYLESTAYKSQVVIYDLPTIEVNESLFCTAIDNLIRNGLKYNDSNNKYVEVFIEDGFLILQDNGRGLTQQELEKYSEPYTRKDNQKESGSGLGLNICIAILKEHGFKLTCERNEIGTKMKIKII